MATNPMHQFQVHKIGPEIKIAGIDLSFTNASLFMLLSATAICVVLFLGSIAGILNVIKTAKQMQEKDKY